MTATPHGHHTVPRKLALLLLLLAMAPNVFSQTVRFTGRVSDTTGAILAGAKIVAQNEQTGQTTTAVAGSDGTYTIELLTGRYTIKVSAAGYVLEEAEHVLVSAGASSSANFTLSPVLRHPTGGRPVPPPPPPLPSRPPREPISGLPTSAPIRKTTGRSFLASGENEETGFGLYSYLLFSSEPGTDAEKARDIAVIDAFVKLLSDVGDLQAAGAAKSELNVTYLLVLEHPSGQSPTAEWVLSHYDFPRAKALLRLFGRDALGGPYVTSALVPLSHAKGAPKPYLWQDMSQAQSDVAVAWEKEFERRAARSNFWAKDTRDQALLEMRDFISNAALGLGMTGEAEAKFKSMLGEWISWK